jgi:probable F420-dependent oxidoreductase
MVQYNDQERVNPPKERGEFMRSQRPFRFGVTTRGATSLQEWRSKAREIEDAGYATLVIADHFSCDFSPIAALLSAAEVTHLLRLGSFVFVNDFRHPALLAKEVATLDVLSGGRFELGLGAGGDREDYEQAGMAFDPGETRLRRLEEALRIIQGLFSDEPLTFAGNFYTIKNLVGLPKPVQRPSPPLLIGGSGKRLLALAAQQADIIGVHCTNDPQEQTEEALARRVEWIRHMAAERFELLELNLLILHVEVTAEPDRVALSLIQERGWTGITAQCVLDMPYFLIGSLDQITEKIERLRQRYHVSYFVVFERHRHAFAPVVARLAGA